MFENATRRLIEVLWTLGVNMSSGVVLAWFSIIQNMQNVHCLYISQYVTII